MKRVSLFLLAALTLCAQTKPKPPKTPRLYVFDCGSLTMSAPQLFGFTKEEVGEKQAFAIPCYLVVHPKGTLIWDVGVIPDALVPATERGTTVKRTLRSQLAEIGYKPEDITYLAVSHMHSDHTANANDFAGSTWLVHQTERDAMFAPPAPAGQGGGRGGGPVNPSFYDKLKDAKTKILPESDYDVFGDGTVIIQYAPGHTPGHQMLFLKLKESGPILIAGDLYHLPQELTMHRVTNFEFNKDISAASHEKTEAFLRKSGARLWIEHDPTTFVTLKKSPDYYQ